MTDRNALIAPAAIALALPAIAHATLYIRAGSKLFAFRD